MGWISDHVLGTGEPQTAALGRPRTFLNVVLDDSTSMYGAVGTTLQAFNDFIAQQRAVSATAKDEVFVSLTLFSDAKKVRTVYTGVPLTKVPVLTPLTYQAMGGSTALYDGVAQAIRDVETRLGLNARVLMLVITDGLENASRRTTLEQLRQMVSVRQEQGNWTFIFLSAGSNPYATGQSMGFHLGNIRGYSGSAAVGESLVHVGTAVKSYRTSDNLQTDTFFEGTPPKHERPNWSRAGTDDVEDVV